MFVVGVGDDGDDDDDDPDVLPIMLISLDPNFRLTLTWLFI